MRDGSGKVIARDTGLTRTDKSGLLETLAHTRQATRWEGYRSIADYHDGAYECGFVSPYTKSAGNVDAQVFLLLQDWCSDTCHSGPLDPDLMRYGRKPTLPTNRTLDRLVETHLGQRIDHTYATNLFPFVKTGAMTAKIPVQDLVRAAEMFTLPQIEIVGAPLVIALGLSTYNALARAVGLPIQSTIDDVLAQRLQLGHQRIWCQAHPGGLGQASRQRGRVDRITDDWQAMKIARVTV
jgi:uracil-DNA glycosylase